MPRNTLWLITVIQSILHGLVWAWLGFPIEAVLIAVVTAFIATWLGLGCLRIAWPRYAHRPAQFPAAGAYIGTEIGLLCAFAYCAQIGFYAFWLLWIVGAIVGACVGAIDAAIWRDAMVHTQKH